MTEPTICGFCRGLMQDDCPGERLEPERLAADFTRHFGVPLRVSLDDLAVLLESAGVGPISGTRLKDGLRGVHYTQPGGGYAIHYEERQWEGGKVHTVLHETYEIICETLWDKQFQTAPSRDLCPDADRFAAAVLMPPTTFAAYAHASGLNVAALRQVFRCAYSAVAIRLVEVLSDQPMVVTLYERKGQGDPDTWPATTRLEDLRATVVKRAAGMGAPRSLLIKGWYGGIPRKGKPMSAGSLAERAARSGKPEYAEGDGLAVVAAPVLWKGRLAKVIVVAVPWEQRAVLLPQLRRAASHPRELPAGTRPAAALP